jgi:membrane-associated phospholipid phosphatase
VSILAYITSAFYLSQTTIQSIKDKEREPLKRIILSTLTTYIIIQPLWAIDIEKIGDALLVLIPSITFGTTLYYDNKEGQRQLYKSFATNTLITYGLKYGVKRERPNREDNYSFPSGHTSATFQSASFIHKRYGLKYAIPAYIGVTFVGYSRVDSKSHYKSDVLAGAIIGSLSSFYFTTKYRRFEIKPIAINSGYGVKIEATW